MSFGAGRLLSRTRGAAYAKAGLSYTVAVPLSGEGRRGALTFLPNFAAPAPSVVALIPAARDPTYDDLFALLFTWLTHGQTVENRRRFVEWWSYENGVTSDPRLASVADRTPRNPQRSIEASSPVLTTFKELVDGFLARHRDGGSAGVSVPMNFAPPSGAIPYAIGQASVVRIPVPNTNGLCVELLPARACARERLDLDALLPRHHGRASPAPRLRLQQNLGHDRLPLKPEGHERNARLRRPHHGRTARGYDLQSREVLPLRRACWSS